MTTRAERLEGAISPAVFQETKGGLLFLRFGRSEEPDPLSSAARLVCKLKNQGYLLQEESVLSGGNLIGTLSKLLRFANNYETVHIFFEHSTARITLALPAIILARFFGCRLILSLVGPIDDPPLGPFGGLVRRFLSLCDEITVPSAHHHGLLKRCKVNSRTLAPLIEASFQSKSDHSSIVPTVLVALPLEEASNIPSAIRAVELVKQKYPRTRMLIIGSGSQKGKLESIASAINHDAIEIVTNQSQQLFCEHLQEADIFLCASLDNCLPESLIYALHIGVPVVAVANAVISELITDRVNGLLTDRGDHVALAGKLFELVESEELRRQLAERGLLTVRPLEGGSALGEWNSLYH